MAEDRLTAPKPLDEHRRLAAFAGEWSGEETVFPSRWVAGGPALSQVSARLGLNGFCLIQDTLQTRDGKETFATHGVFTFDREDGRYKLFWHDSLGYFAPARLGSRHHEPSQVRASDQQHENNGREQHEGEARDVAANATRHGRPLNRHELKLLGRAGHAYGDGLGALERALVAGDHVPPHHDRTHGELG